MNLLITGGAGYIGSHTILNLLSKGYQSIHSIDNYINSQEINYHKIYKISGVKVIYHAIDLTDFETLNNFFAENKFDAIIHFAALKSVPDSMVHPLEYYENNVGGMINLVKCMSIHQVKNIIFSSSCSVYGNPEKLPVNENTPIGKAESPYARTKQIGESLLADYCAQMKDAKAISLRYFNPVGAHSSGLIGEGFTPKPNNLVPIITQSAAGLRGPITVFGTDYETIDGSCVRDFIHVDDVAEAHVLALNLFQANINYLEINIGTGNGTSVLQIIESFQKVNNIKLNYKLGNRRPGDVESIYADNQKATELLKWTPKHDLNSMMSSAWKWQQNMAI